MSPLPIDVYHESSRLLTKLKSYYAKEEAPPPLLSANLALGITLLYTALYIAPFYLSPTLRTTPLTSRDHPTVIRARVRAVALTCLLCTTTTVLLLTLHAHATFSDTLRLLGLYPILPLDTLRVLALVALLFIGPLYETLIVDADYRLLHPSSLYHNLWTSPQGHRNLLIAPLSEELVFRSLSLALHLLAKTLPSQIILTTPLIFGLAHLHHLYDLLAARTPPGRRLPSMPVVLASLAQMALMFAYTSLFGAFAVFVFLRTGNFYAVVGAHMFCNAMGLPRFWGRVGQYHDSFEVDGDEEHEMTPDGARGKRSDDSFAGLGSAGLGAEREKARREGMAKGRRGSGVAWTVGYYVLLVLGAVGFARQLWPWTESPNALAVV